MAFFWQADRDRLARIESSLIRVETLLNARTLSQKEITEVAKSIRDETDKLQSRVEETNDL